MRYIKMTITDNPMFERSLVVLQMSCGCIIQKKRKYVYIYSFNEMQDVIIDTLKEEAESELIFCKIPTKIV